MPLRGLPVLLTGATGLVGGALARRLAEAGARVTALVRDPARAKDLEARGVRLVRGDLGDEAALEEAARGQALVFHSAARASDTGPLSAFLEDNLEGTKRLFSASRAAGARRFVFLSTISTYGFSPPPKVTEETPIEPFRGSYPYALSKVRTERWLHDAVSSSAVSSSVASSSAVSSSAASSSGEMELVIARVGSVYGPGSSQWTLRPARMFAQSPLGMLLVEGGQGLHNFIYLDNLVDALLVLGSHDEAAGGTFNLTEDAKPYAEFFGAYARMVTTRKPKVRDLSRRQALALAFAVEQASGLFGRPPALTRVAVRLLCRRSVISSEKLRALGWAPKVSFEEGMDACEGWLRDQGVL